MAYLLSNIYTKNYWNPTTIVETIVGGLVVSFLRHSVDLYALENQGTRAGIKAAVRLPLSGGRRQTTACGRCFVFLSVL